MSDLVMIVEKLIELIRCWYEKICSNVAYFEIFLNFSKLDKDAFEVLDKTLIWNFEIYLLM